MEVIKNLNGDALQVKLVGRLDTTTAPSLEAELSSDIAKAKTLEFDFAGLDYVSSAGLRVLLACQKQMDKQGNMSIKNVKDEIYEVFSMTGFLDILNVSK